MIAWACGGALRLDAGDALGHHLLRPGVVDAELVRVALVRDPVGARVAHPARDDERAVHDRRDERARRRVLAVGHRADGRQDRVLRGPRGVTDERRPGGDPRRRLADDGGGALRGARGQQVARRPRRREARDVGVGRGGDAVAHDERGERAVRGRGRARGERHRVLVAGVPHAAVAHAGDPRRGALGPVVPLGRGRLAALGAVPVLGDAAPAPHARPDAGVGGAVVRRGRRVRGRTRRRLGAGGCPVRSATVRRLAVRVARRGERGERRAARLAEPRALGRRLAARRAREHCGRRRDRLVGVDLAAGGLVGDGLVGYGCGGLAHRTVHRRTSFARSTSVTRSSRESVSDASSR